MAKLSKANLAILGIIVASASNAEAPFSFQSPTDVKALLAETLVEQNPDINDGAGKLATRATDAGVARFNEENGSTASTGTVATTPSAPKATAFVTGSGFDVAVARTARPLRGQRYDFDSLDVGGYIYVPATEAKPDPAKSLASTVSAATGRFAEKVEGETRVNRKGETVPKTKNTRVFEVFAVKAGTTYGAFTPEKDGAAIVRTA